MAEIPPQFTEYPREVMRPRIRFEVISEAWRFLTAELGTWVLASFLAILLTIVLFLPVYLVGFFQMAASKGQFSVGQMMSFYGFMFLATMLMYVGQSIGYAGMYNLALKQIQGYPISIRDFFSTGGSVFSHIGAGFLIAIGITVGAMLCYLPGLIVGGMLMFTHPIIVHRRLGTIEAMRTSWRLLSNDLWMATAFYFVIALVASLGSFVCGIGLLFSYPLLPLGVALVYRDYTQVDPTVSAGPYAPYNIMDR